MGGSRVGDVVRVLIVHPGADHSTADVEAGLRYGLEQHGVEVFQYRLDNRIPAAQRQLSAEVRRARKTNPTIELPTWADVLYMAGKDVLIKALRHQVDAVIVVSGMLLHPDVIVLLRRAHVKVVALFTESPYDVEQGELGIAKLVDGCWTNERNSVERFAAVNRNVRYLPAAWHPGRHTPAAPATADLNHATAHDVLFVGSGFPSRIDWLSAIDWTGIDLGLYGTWQNITRRHPLRPFVRDWTIANDQAAALYHRAKIVLNLYRDSVVVSPTVTLQAPGESLNPRAYELAACGVFALSEQRAESAEIFGDRVPCFTTPEDASRLIRRWLPDAAGRARVAGQLPALVAESSWTVRAAQVIGDLQSLLTSSRAA